MCILSMIYNGNITRDELGLCVAAHKGDLAELSNTLRHEAMHVAQACHCGSIAENNYLTDFALETGAMGSLTRPATKRSVMTAPYNVALLRTQHR